jgi:hypothetical protein
MGKNSTSLWRPSKSGDDCLLAQSVRGSGPAPKRALWVASFGFQRCREAIGRTGMSRKLGQSCDEEARTTRDERTGASSRCAAVVASNHGYPDRGARKPFLRGSKRLIPGHPSHQTPKAPSGYHRLVPKRCREATGGTGGGLETTMTRSPKKGRPSPNGLAVPPPIRCATTCSPKPGEHATRRADGCGQA